ncbi:hypothetical protein F4679DRAFT_519911 [Xylaria curta]|nr:hypothetical protein F4679DRAFT_519911 [Xylaria curta]
MSIQPLPDDVIAQIKSSTTITSLNGVVCGLFQNSLDSGAAKIAVSVDYVRGSCSVEDDGLGILPAEFKPGGGLGKLHFTSKYPANEGIHGKYGAFLASLASLSLLSITSHHHKYLTHNTIRIHHSDVLDRHTPSPPDQRLLSFPHGTRVTVRDLFGSMPVRVKQRAIDAERGIHYKHWETLKRDIVALMLAWNMHISVSVREPTSRWTFSVRISQTPQEKAVSELDLTAKVSKILYQAQLSDEKPEVWVPLRASAGRLSVTGAVSLHPIATRRVQFISIGIRPVPNEHGSNVLYEEINRIFSNSSYGVEEVYTPKAEADGKTKDGQFPLDKFTSQELRGRKGVDRWPMFYIRIHIDESSSSIALKDIGELFDERHANLAAIVDVLKAVAYEFLKKYQFRPKRVRNTREDIPSKTSRPNSPKRSLTSKHDEKATLSATGTCNEQLVGDLATTRLSIHYDRASRSRSESPFNLWPRIKPGVPQHVLNDKKLDGKSIGDGHHSSDAPGVASTDTDTNDHDSTPSLFDPDGRLLRAPFLMEDPVTHSAGQKLQSVRTQEGHSNEDIRWTDPVTKQTSIINPQTGFIIPSSKDPFKGRCEGSDSISCKRLRLHNKSKPDADRSVWVKELLSSWENPVFKTTEPCIPSAFGDENSLCRPMQTFGCSTWFQGSSEVGAPIQGRVSKAALRRAGVIAQVDQKFIFAKVLVDSCSREPTVPHSTASLLILIDQHAADERCRVESLMKDYFVDMDDILRSQAAPMTGNSVACAELLERPLKFDISVRDAAQLEGALAHFSHWGIHYRILQVGTVGHRQVEVMQLPPSIIERCRLEPRLLIELLRKEAWKTDDHHSRDATVTEPSNQDSEAATPHWITKFHGCPKGILDMINSRACRSSIMFNDPLTQEECANLLKQLADCAFPFQCAHGRPSMVPLVDLGDSTAYTSHERKPTDSFKKAFKTWNAGG